MTCWRSSQSQPITDRAPVRCKRWRSSCTIKMRMLVSKETRFHQNLPKEDRGSSTVLLTYTSCLPEISVDYWRLVYVWVGTCGGHSIETKTDDIKRSSGEKTIITNPPLLLRDFSLHAVSDRKFKWGISYLIFDQISGYFVSYYGIDIYNISHPQTTPWRSLGEKTIRLLNVEVQ